MRVGVKEKRILAEAVLTLKRLPDKELSDLLLNRICGDKNLKRIDARTSRVREISAMLEA